MPGACVAAAGAKAVLIATNPLPVANQPEHLLGAYKPAIAT